MKLFNCSSCSNVVFFESSVCTNCGATLGYQPEAKDSITLSWVENGSSERLLQELGTPAHGRRYRACKNWLDFDVCNWILPAESNHEYCVACQLNATVPNPHVEEDRSAWLKVETAKRRLIYTLLDLGLPLKAHGSTPGLRFAFLRGSPQRPVTTGHAGGTVTIDIAESDHEHRERVRESMGESYRTLLGHLRHESGHYYWDRLLRGSARLPAFRATFGDERQNYRAALQRHYEAGPPQGWSNGHITAYASAHPWEDWAETWAHYLHMVDTLETAHSYGLSLDAAGVSRGAPALHQVRAYAFDELMDAWLPLTLALNSLNRSMGMQDPYPFVVSDQVRSKLEFVHDCIVEGSGSGWGSQANGRGPRGS